MYTRGEFLGVRQNPAGAKIVVIAIEANLKKLESDKAERGP